VAEVFGAVAMEIGGMRWESRRVWSGIKRELKTLVDDLKGSESGSGVREEVEVQAELGETPRNGGDEKEDAEDAEREPEVIRMDE